MKYKVTEIFNSIQGEGFWTGTPMTFVRFSGCNLSCSFCDTDFSYYEELTETELVHRIIDLRRPRVVLTGGEPTLQVTQSLVHHLHAHQKLIHMESNGTQSGPRVDWLTISPKTQWRIKTGQELKVLYQAQDLTPYLSSQFDHYFLQPLSHENVYETINAIGDGTQWRLSIQTHKLLSIR